MFGCTPLIGGRLPVSVGGAKGPLYTGDNGEQLTGWGCFGGELHAMKKMGCSYPVYTSMMYNDIGTNNSP